jgi:DNA-binding transcriptional MerR regulator
MEEIKEILDLYDRGRAPCGRVADVGRNHLRELDARIGALRAFRRDLAAVPGFLFCRSADCDVV